MSARAGDKRPLRINWRLAAFLLAGASAVVFAAANVHLVYVAFVSQPDCVPHAKAMGNDGTFRAARSAC